MTIYIGEGGGGGGSSQIPFLYHKDMPKAEEHTLHCRYNRNYS